MLTSTMYLRLWELSSLHLPECIEHFRKKYPKRIGPSYPRSPLSSYMNKSKHSPCLKRATDWTGRVKPAIDKTGFGSSKSGASYISLGKAEFASVQSKVPFVWHFLDNTSLINHYPLDSSFKGTTAQSTLASCFSGRRGLRVQRDSCGSDY